MVESGSGGSRGDRLCRISEFGVGYQMWVGASSEEWSRTGCVDDQKQDMRVVKNRMCG